jgi:outer membrane protein
LKNVSLVLNAILLIAVAFLYYKVYSEDKPVTVSPVVSGAGMPANAIVFINSDTLLEKYDYFNTVKKGLEKKQDSLDKVVRSRAALLEKEVGEYQQKGASMTSEQRAAEEEKLMMKQQQLMEMKESLVGQLQDEEMQMNDSIHHNLTRYLKEYNKDKNYLFILGYQQGSGILLANDSLDITKEVLEGLNKK